MRSHPTRSEAASKRSKKARARKWMCSAATFETVPLDPRKPQQPTKRNPTTHPKTGVCCSPRRRRRPAAPLWPRRGRSSPRAPRTWKSPPSLPRSTPRRRPTSPGASGWRARGRCRRRCCCGTARFVMFVFVLCAVLTALTVLLIVFVSSCRADPFRSPVCDH